MVFTETELNGVYLVDVEPIEDARGFFARSWSLEEFAARGLNPRIAQCSVSLNHAKGTLRGLHYQVAPHEEAKLVRCTNGAIFDVAVDIRPSSPTFGRHVAVELTARNRRALYIPEGCAHGFLTLEDASEVFYQISMPYAPAAARGIRWDDPRLAIPWPGAVSVISDRDRSLPGLEPAEGKGGSR